MALTLKWMPAFSFGGRFGIGRPTCVVVHCTESENNPNTAEALAGPNWFGGKAAGTSAHKIVDQDSICEGVRRTNVAYHAGPAGNVRGIAYEFCGRASWSKAKWREPAQLRMLRNSAKHIADDLRSMGAPARWLSLAQLAGNQKGLCTHNDIRLAFGGTTHSDPGPNFPYAELLQYVNEEMGGGGGIPIIGAIRVAYDRYAGRLGAPRGPEVPTADGVGRWQEFAGGVVYWHPWIGTAHVVWGAILQTWRLVGSEMATGYPITDEMTCPDGIGKYNHFSGMGNRGATSIYCAPGTGAQVVWGKIRALWAAEGYERGRLGYPTSGEFNAEGGIVQNFQRGSILWINGAGIVRIR